MPVIKACEKIDNIKYSLVLSGSHVLKKSILNDNEIKLDNLKNIIKLDISNNFKESAKMAISVSRVIKALTIVIQRIKPNILIVYGDRFETLGATIAGHENNIIIGHIEGGDKTFGGTHDDNIRHAITKLSHFHFTTNKDSYARVLALGEEKWRVKHTGFPAIDLIKRKDYTDKGSIIEKYKLKKECPILLFTLHPLSFSFDKTKREIDSCIKAIRKSINTFNAICIITYPNNDFGSKYIIQKIKIFKSKHKNVLLYRSLGRKDYWGVMNLVRFNFKVICIGNSSSGIKESTAFSCPTINIGDRQKGRLAGKNILHCSAEEYNIFNLIKKCIKDKVFIKQCKNFENPYGKGNAGKKIANFLNKLNLNQNTLIKKITL